MIYKNRKKDQRDAEHIFILWKNLTINQHGQKSVPHQEGRGAAGFRLPLLPSGPGGVRRRLLARFLARDNLWYYAISDMVKVSRKISVYFVKKSFN